MKTFARILALLFALLGPAAAQSTLLSRPPVFNGSNSFSSWTSDHDSSTANKGDQYITSDSFTLSGASSITSLTWQGLTFTAGSNTATFGVPRSFNIQFRTDSNGTPGTLLYTATVSYTQANAGTIDLFRNGSIETVYNYSASLPTAFSTSANTTYWVSIVGNADYPTYWSWAQGTGGDNSCYQNSSTSAAFKTGDRALSLIGTLSPVHNWSASRVGVAPDGSSRVQWSNVNGAVFVQSVLANGTNPVSATYGPYTGMIVKGFAVAPDGTSRLLWTTTGGQARVWTLAANGSLTTTGIAYGPYSGSTATGVTVTADGQTRLLWATTAGAAQVWTLDATGRATAYGPSFGPYSGGAHVSAIGAGADGKIRLLWSTTANAASVWILNGTAHVLSYGRVYGPYDGAAVHAVSGGADGKSRLLWSNSTNAASVWTAYSDGTVASYGATYGPYAGATAHDVSTGADNVSRMLWTNSAGQASVWSIAPNGAVTYSPNLGPF